MRTINRLHAVVFLAICSLVYVGWVLPSLRVQSRFQKVLSGSRRRIVVFGDSWSDTGEYKVAVPKTNPQANVSHPLWTEALCAELLCDAVDNYARSSGSLDFKAYPDALVDTDVVANVTNQNPSNAKFKADFGTQVQRWINSEQQRLNQTGGVQEKIVFTVFFGISDVWQYVGMGDKEAHEGIRQGIRTLFAHLDAIARFMRKPIQVILPRIPDITFFPAFGQQPEGPFPTYQRSAVFLVEKWNTELERAAREWYGGYVHLLAMDKWLLEMLREQQMYTIGIADENGDGKRSPTFTETTSPCLPLPVTGVQYPFDMDDANSNRTAPCADASQYLFWDAVHLSSKAHRLLAAQAADLVSHNDTFNLNTLRKHEQELAEAEKKAKEQKTDDAEMDSTNSES